MDKDQFQPVEKSHSNFFFRGYETSSEAVKSGKIGDIPATRDAESISTIWKMSGFRQRLRFLFRGEITVRLLGQRLPPMAVVVGDIYGDAKIVGGSMRGISRKEEN